MRYAIDMARGPRGTIFVTVPDFPAMFIRAVDREDAAFRASEAIDTAIVEAIFTRQDIPWPEGLGADHVTLPALSAAKIELYRAMQAEGVCVHGLAARLGVAPSQIHRLLDLHHNSGLDAIERALAAVGRTLWIVVKRRREGTREETDGRPVECLAQPAREGRS
jgi:antitoxin HicB